MSTPKSLMSARKQIALNVSRLLVLCSTVSALSLVAGAAPAHAAFPGENGKIAFTSNRDGNEEIYVMNADGSNQTRLTNNAGEDDGAAFSPDGTKIAFYSFRGNNGDIYIMNADGSGQTRVTTNGGPDGAPAFSPDGSKIAFWSVRDGNTEIYVMNADGTGQTRLTTNPGQDIDPVFSPDGTKIAFYSTRGGKQDTYVMNADGTGQTNLTDSPVGDPGPSFSPDGSKIAFGSNRGTAGDFEVVVMDPDGSNQTNITNTTAHELEPAFSPDGTKIAYRHGGEAGDSEIYVMNADGTGQTRLTDNVASDNAPDWGPAVADAPPSAVDDAATVDEGSGAGTIDVLANDTDSDGGPKTIVTATDPGHGTVVLTGPVGARDGLTYEPDAGYCNDPDPAPADTFDYSLNGGSSATVTVTVICADITPPNTTITGGPDGSTNDNTPTFTFTSSEAGSTFECSIGGGFVPCTSPHTTDSLGDGDHTFKVRAQDAAGNVDETPAGRSFTIDRSPPTTSITSGPSGATGDSTPTFGFTSPDSDVTYECRVDDAAFDVCPNPHTTAELNDGEHVFQVRAVDSTGNIDPIPAAVAFTVDTVAPDTTIRSGPTGTIGDNTPTFSWEYADGALAHECRVDDQPFVACESPETTDTLSDGQHTFELRAIDGAGNTDPTPASRTFTIDTEALVTGITAGPSGLINDPTPTFSFTTSEPGSTFECKVSGGFEPCTSPYTSAALTDGEHTFQVRSTDSLGNVESPAVGRTFTVDTTAPDTAITSGPTGTIDDQTPTFGFSSPESGATLECRVDDADFGPCASPYTTTLLANGAHTFQARATDAAGNADPTPAGRMFTVNIDSAAPETRIDSGPANLTNQVDPTFTFSANEPATFECKLDAGSFAPCESGDELGPLDEGSHTFSVRATDLAGNVDPTPATKDWIVDTTPPQTTITSAPPWLTLSSKARFAFTSSEGGSSFQCQLDGRTWQACTSPHDYTGIRLGTHSVSVRAIDPAGNIDPTPAERTWSTLGVVLL